MKKGDKRKRRKALKKRTTSKRDRRQVRAAGATSVRSLIRRARDYPIEGCWAMDGWEEGGMTVIVIARRQPNGNIAYGGYMVDLYCLGLKNTFCNADIPTTTFHREVMPQAFGDEPPVEISPALAHEIIYGSIEYAAQYGFRPQRDYRLSQYILDPQDAHPRTGTVEFGHEGKPLFVSGPYDNVDAILRQLERTAGEGNYDYIVQVGDPSTDVWDEE
jgi:hypothetical protein